MEIMIINIFAIEKFFGYRKPIDNLSFRTKLTFIVIPKEKTNVGKLFNSEMTDK